MAVWRKALWIAISSLCLSQGQLLASNEQSGITTKHNTFWAEHEEGWFFYDDPPPELEKEDEEKAEPKPPKPVAKKPEVDTGQPEPAVFSAKWMRENLDKYKDIAIDNPTEDNVARYFYLQRVVMDKADRFSDVASEVIMKYPDLDNNTRTPTGGYAAIEARRVANKGKKEIIKLIGERAGMFFFFASDCPYCHKQAPILASMAAQYDLTIRAVSIDHKPMPNGLFQDFVPDQGQAQRLNVVSTPALFLVEPGNGIIPLVQGAITQSELIDRMILAAHKTGVISDKEFDKTQLVGSNRTIMANNEHPGTPITDETVEDSSRFIDRIRKVMRENP